MFWKTIIGKIIKSRYIGIFPIINKIIDIGRRLPQIIGDLKDKAKLSSPRAQRAGPKGPCAESARAVTGT